MLPSPANSFLKTDLETALTFSAMALKTNDPAKKRRLTAKARKAFHTILRLMDKVKLTRSDTQFMTENLHRLKRELLRLGVVF